MRNLVSIMVLGACATSGDPELAERPQSLIICHNANCAHATEPYNDDTLAALDDSLRLEYQGRPVIDGVEIDTMWDRTTSACIFGHDFEHLPVPAETAHQAVDRVIAHLQQDTPFVSWSGNRFAVKIELKQTVTAAADLHDEAERAAHLDCALDMTERLLAAADATGRELELMFESENVDMIRGLAAHARWPGKSPYPRARLRLVVPARSVTLTPADLESLGNGAEGAGIDVLSFHTSRLPDGMQQSFVSLDLDLMLWMLDASVETLYAMDVYRPMYVVTSEAAMFRRWEEF